MVKKGKVILQGEPGIGTLSCCGKTFEFKEDKLEVSKEEATLILYFWKDIIKEVEHASNQSI